MDLFSSQSKTKNTIQFIPPFHIQPSVTPQWSAFQNVFTHTHTHPSILSTYLAVCYTLLPRTRHHLQFGIVWQVGEPHWQREVNHRPLEPVTAGQ